VTWFTNLARPEIRALKPYEHASWEPTLVRLHANELPWRSPADTTAAGLNRYPEPHPLELAARLAPLYGVAPDVGAGVAQPWTLVVPKGQGAAVKTAVVLTSRLEAPIAKGAVIGKVVATANGKPLGEAPVIALAGVERAGFFQRLGQRISGWFSK
jgi:D-alanyl-D-alanine carboxypeptidase (penicillin-binding protein 5/6)